MSRHRIRLAVAVTSVLTICVGTLAWAGWSSAAHGVASSQTAWVPAPATPEVATAATGVEVSWDATAVGGTTATAYRLERRNTVSGAVRAATGGCAGTVAALTCVDDAVAPGTWTYRVRALLGPWTGPWSTASAPVVVEGSTAAAFTITPTGATPGDPVTVAGTGWPEHETVTVEVGPARLCTATTDAAGAFNAECLAPSLAHGAHATRAFGGDVLTTGAAFAVVPGLREVTRVVSEGGTLWVRARGFAASSPVTVSIDQWTGPLKEAVTNSSGDTSLLSLTVPAGTDAGEHELRVQDGAGNSATATFTAVTAGLEVSPTSASPGTSVHLSGANWPPGGTVQVRVRQIPLCAPVADANGVVDTTCTLPDTPAGATEIVGASGGVVEGAAFTVLSRLSTSSPTTSSGSTLTVTGRGFGGNTSGTLTIGGTAVSPNSPIATTSTGHVTITVKVPALEDGPHEVRLTDSLGNSAATTVTVVSPTITMSPTSGPIGTVFRYTGTNWPANSTVTVEWTGSSIGSCLATSDADGDVASGNCTVPGQLPGGPRNVTARSGSITLATAAVFHVEPKATVNELRATPGQTVTVSGTGLPAGENVRFTMGGTEVAVVRADSYGVASKVVTVPDLPTGSAGVVVEGTLGTSPPAPFTIFRPTLELDQTEIRPGQTRVRLTGAGWPTSIGIDAQLAGAWVCTGYRATSTGTLDATCLVTRAAGGEDQLFRAIAGKVVADTTVDVVAALRLDRTSAAPGTSVTATAQGLRAGVAVELVVNGSVTATGTAATDGSWTRSFTVPADTPPGPLEVLVRQTGFPSATATLTVT